MRKFWFVSLNPATGQTFAWAYLHNVSVMSQCNDTLISKLLSREHDGPQC
jgi:hypothetical protein